MDSPGGQFGLPELFTDCMHGHCSSLVCIHVLEVTLGSQQHCHYIWGCTQLEGKVINNVLELV